MILKKLGAYGALALILCAAYIAAWRHYSRKAQAPADLAEAVHAPRAARAEKLGILVLAQPDGSAGLHYREQELATQGIDLSDSSMRALESFLHTAPSRDPNAAKAMRALCYGWMLRWDLDKYLDCAMERKELHRVADYLNFLKAIASAPITLDNRARLEEMDRFAQGMSIATLQFFDGHAVAGDAQKFYEGFSGAYAHFGDRKRFMEWWHKISGLYPLISDDIHVELLARNVSGRASGSLFFNDRPAREIQVGLFVLHSTFSMTTADEGLVGAVYPDEEGRFSFSHLAEGDYYLALRAPPYLFWEGHMEYDRKPGAFPITKEQPNFELWPMYLMNSSVAVPSGEVEVRDINERLDTGLRRNDDPKGSVRPRAVPGVLR